MALYICGWFVQVYIYNIYGFAVATTHDTDNCTLRAQEECPSPSPSPVSLDADPDSSSKTEWSHGQTDRWTDGQANRQADRSNNNYTRTVGHVNRSESKSNSNITIATAKCQSQICKKPKGASGGKRSKLNSWQLRNVSFKDMARAWLGNFRATSLA